MTVLPERLRQINEDLAALSARFADGDVDRASFRQGRRQLICDAIGVAVPELPAEHDQLHLPGEDDTMPGTPPDASSGVEQPAEGLVPGSEEPEVVDSTPQPEVEAPDASGDESASRPEPVKVKDATLQITLLLLLLAFVGLGGLLWFVLR